MLLNKNKIVCHIAKRTLKENKGRNIVAILAIIMTCTLFTSVFTIGSNLIRCFNQQLIRQAGTDGHAILKYITEEEYNKIKKHPLIKAISYNKVITQNIDDPALSKRQEEMYYMDEVGRQVTFCEPTVGKAPKDKCEIITDTTTLDLLGIPHKVGETVSLSYTIKGQLIQSDFILSGFWESDPAINVGIIVVSKDFVEANESLLLNTYKKDYDATGGINAYIMFENSYNLQEKLKQVIEESGYKMSMEAMNRGDNEINCNVNWAYLGSNSSGARVATILVIMVLLLLTGFIGYLIIYNIFQISIMKDIRFYGLLKTIGASASQVKTIINWQAVVLASIGIPFGMLIGFTIGKIVLPMMIALSDFKLDKVSFNFAIFVGAAIFTLLTIFISIHKPGKMATKVSPLEALNYRGIGEHYTIKKHSTNGGKLYKMAFENLKRYRKRTVMVIISMALGLIMLNSAFTILKGLDLNKFLSKFVATDFLIAHKKYFKSDYKNKLEVILSNDFIEAAKSQESFKEGGKIYCNYYEEDCSVYNREFDINTYQGEEIPRAENDEPLLTLFGLDDLLFSKLEVIDGEIDLEKLKSGHYIIEGVQEDDYQRPIWETSHYKVGEKVKTTIDGKLYEYEIMAKIKVKHYTLSTRTTNLFSMYLPTEAFLKVVTRPIIMSYAYNVKAGKSEAMQAFLEQYTTYIEPTMGYESKQIYLDEFKGFQQMIITIGGILCGIIGLIAILNFINLIVTSILTRQKEFAMLQSIGMTTKQLKTMLCYEGIYYAGIAILIALVLSIIISITIIWKGIGNLWFFSYSFTLMPLIIMMPFLIGLTIIIPYIAYSGCNKKSIIERLSLNLFFMVLVGTSLIYAMHV